MWQENKSLAECRAPESAFIPPPLSGESHQDKLSLHRQALALSGNREVEGGVRSPEVVLSQPRKGRNFDCYCCNWD